MLGATTSDSSHESSPPDRLKHNKVGEEDKGSFNIQSGSSLFASRPLANMSSVRRFVATLFRAVKLNKLDVLRILVRIVHKSGLRLSMRELREPESSATVLHVAMLYNHASVVEYIIQQVSTTTSTSYSR